MIKFEKKTIWTADSEARLQERAARRPQPVPHADGLAIETLLSDVRRKAHAAMPDAAAVFVLTITGVIVRNGVVVDTVPTCLPNNAWIVPRLATAPIFRKKTSNYKK